jgi:hypothetical protein
LGKLTINRPNHWNPLTPLLLEDTTWIVPHYYEFFPLNIQIITNQQLKIIISSPTVFNNSIINKINFFIKGIDFLKFWNGAMNKSWDLYSYQSLMGQGKIQWNSENYGIINDDNSHISNLLYSWWAPDTQKFFRWQLDDFGWVNEISLVIPWNEGAVNITLENNYFYAVNYFPKESLPILLNDEPNWNP